MASSESSASYAKASAATFYLSSEDRWIRRSKHSRKSTETTSNSSRSRCGKTKSHSEARKGHALTRSSSSESRPNAPVSKWSLVVVASATRARVRSAYRMSLTSLTASRQVSHAGNGCTRRSESSTGQVTFEATQYPSFQYALKTMLRYPSRLCRSWACSTSALLSGNHASSSSFLIRRTSETTTDSKVWPQIVIS